MPNDSFATAFSRSVCATLLPPERANEFFEALFGDASEGAYDLELKYHGTSGDTIRFDLLLHQRPGHCLACNLTYGLPQVFSRHPVINIAGMVDKIKAILAEKVETTGWKLGSTSQLSNALHSIPLMISIKR